MLFPALLTLAIVVPGMLLVWKAILDNRKIREERFNRTKRNQD